jgi:replicative DNA helicase
MQMTFDTELVRWLVDETLEAAVLYALLDPSKSSLFDIVHVLDFASDQNKTLFRVLHEASGTESAYSYDDVLRLSADCTQAGMAVAQMHIQHIITRGRAAGRVGSYEAMLLREVRQKRQMYSVFRVVEQKLIAGASAEQVIGFANEKMALIAETASLDETRIDAVWDDFLQRFLENQYGNSELAIPTGIANVDKWITGGGIKTGSLTVIAAPPSGGKTTLGLQMVDLAACKGIPSCIISLEMTADELILKLGARRGHKWLSNPKSHPVSQDTLAEYLAELNVEVSQLPLHIIDSVFTLDGITRTIKRLAGRGVKVFLIDYLQLIQTEETRHLGVADCSQRFKNLAKSLDIAIIAPSQITGELTDFRTAKLRWAAEISFDADNIFIIEDTDKTEAVVRGVRVCCQKQRSGARNWFSDCFFICDESRFSADAVSHSEKDPNEVKF